MGKDNLYGGDLSPREAWQRLSNDTNAKLVDCRTHPEWSFVGIPDLRQLARPAVFIPWQNYPSMQRNDQFADQLRDSGIDRDDTVCFICRSGARSKMAAIAMHALGFKNCFNVAHGFEGDHDKHGRRGGVNGWKADGLPWTQE